MTEKKSAIVLLSGGLDSATVLALALTEVPTVHCVSFMYGSKHNPREYEAAESIVAYYNELGFFVGHQKIIMPKIFSYGMKGGPNPSALMDEVDMPQLTYEEIHESEGPSPTVVPFRNANLLSTATTIAVVEGADYVYAGMHGEDAHNFAYPDCTPEFLGAFAACIYIGTYHKVQLKFPFIWYMKKHVLKKALQLNVPLELTWSCYEGRDEQCGTCPTCIERIQAFQWNGEKDPVPYEVDIEWNANE